MKFGSLFLFVFIALFGYQDSVHCGPVEDGLADFEGKIIGNIKIIRKNVFDDLMDRNPPFYYRWANSLHIVTKEGVIRSELLVEAGQPLDIRKLKETARNLRARRFIGEVNITGIPNEDGGVDLTITTIDYWTTKIEMFLETGGGDYVFGAAASEVNFLGYGQTIGVSGQISNDQDGYSIFLRDDRLMQSRISASIFYSDLTLGKIYQFSLARPQYSLTVPFGIKARYLDSDYTIKMYNSGDEFFRYRLFQRRFYLKTVYSLGERRRADFHAGYTYESRDYSPDDPECQDNIGIPADEKKSYPSVGLGFSIIDYDLQRFLDEAGTPEDLTLGGSIRFEIGKSSSVFGAGFEGTKTEISAHFLGKSFNRLFIGGSDRVSWWYHRGDKELLKHRTELMLYYRTAKTQVLAIRGLTNFSWRERSTYQLTLGGNSGLRGYSAHEFSGDKMALGNIEYRFYTPLEILTVRLGGTLFFDVGNVWERGEKVILSDLNTDVGMGLRFGLTKSSTSRILRLDFSKSLSENEYYISFGTNMLFHLKSLEYDD